jgi:hypothetical protein
MSGSEDGNQSDLGMNDMMYFMSDSAEAYEDDSKEAPWKWNIIRNRDKVHPL